MNNDIEFNNINNSFENNENEKISLDSNDNSWDDDDHQDDNFNVSENEQYKIPGLFERLIQNKNNIKNKELIKNSIVKKNNKRSERRK